MSVFCFAALKGGVGKTTLSLNTAHAFARRGCRTVLIDLDPSGHSTSNFKLQSPNIAHAVSSSIHVIPTFRGESVLAREFLGSRAGFEDSAGSLTLPVRTYLDLIPAGPELRHFFWGRGAKVFATSFGSLIEDLKSDYDHIVIDTAPDFNVLSRNAIAAADMVVVPVDSSEMSINSLEELLLSAQHIRGPIWAIVRTMVTRQARSVQRLTSENLQARFDLLDAQDDEPDTILNNGVEDADVFMRMLCERERAKETRISSVDRDVNPIYLLHAVISRTEQQNKLSFQGKTAFDTRATAKLADQYTAVAKELEDIIAYTEGEEVEMIDSDLLLSASHSP